MKKILTGALAAATLGGAALATATPAAAQHYGRGYYGGHRGGGNTAAIGIGAGLLGLAIGSSLSHSNYYAPRGYYAPSYGYGYGNGYYGRPTYGYYGAPGYAYGYGYRGPACRERVRFDPYIGREVVVTRCR